MHRKRSADSVSVIVMNPQNGETYGDGKLS